MEDLLCLLFFSEKLYIIEHEYIYVIEFAHQIVHLVLLDCIYHLIKELACRKICNYLITISLHDVISDRLHQVRLSQSYSSIDEERIVCDSWLCRYCFCSIECQHIIISDYIVLECESCIEDNPYMFRELFLCLSIQ